MALDRIKPLPGGPTCDRINQGLLTVRFLVLDINEAVLKATATQREPAPNGMRPGDLAHTVHQC